MGGDCFLSFDGLEIKNTKEYIDFIYTSGRQERFGSDGQQAHQQQAKGKIGKIADDGKVKLNIWKHRVRYFSDTLVIGSKTFIESSYKRFDDLLVKKDRKVHKLPLSDGIFSIRHINLKT